jgi:chromosome segregation ATPase
LTIDNIKSEKHREGKDKEDLHKKINNLADENEDLVSEIENLKKKNDDLMSQLGETERVKEEYKNKVAALKYEKTRIRDEYVEVSKMNNFESCRKKIESRMII